EIWRYDPKIRNELALQHLTCRGLSYYDASNPASTPAETATAQDVSPTAETTPTTEVTPDTATAAVEENAAATSAQALNLPVAAEEGTTTDQCTAMLFMPTADGRIIALNPDDGTVCENFGAGTGQINLWAN